MSAFQSKQSVVKSSNAKYPPAARAHTAMSSVQHEVTTTTTTSRQVVDINVRGSQPVERKKLVFGWIQDVSGSMAGSRINTAIEGFQFMFREVFQPEDFVGVVTYNQFINSLHLPMPVKNVNVVRDIDAIKAGFLKGAHSDKCYDALGDTIEGLKAISRDRSFRAVTENAVYQVLLVTDGGDNASVKFTLRQITELVARPGLPDFHLTVVAVNMSPTDKVKFQELCNCRHATFLEAGDLGQLKSTLEKVGRTVVSRLVAVHTTVTTTTTSAAVSNRGGAAVNTFPTICRGLQQMSLQAGSHPAIATGTHPRITSAATTMPSKSCSFFARGACTKANCKFMH